MGDYTDLLVWQKAHANTLDIIRSVDRFPRVTGAMIIGRQLVRAAASRGANIAEGHGRQISGERQKDYMNFLRIALGSAQETCNWLQLASDAGYIDTIKCRGLIEVNNEIRKMLFVLIRRIQQEQTQKAS